jgi:uncharacterized BrkB/YihY/UPF0761 family membrane protein
LYYTSLIFLFGAEFTACLGGLRKEQAVAAAKTRTKSDSGPPRAVNSNA